MRLNYDALQRYGTVLDFWQSTCNYNGSSACSRGRCCNPETNEYQKRCDELWSEWHKAGGKGKAPVMPSPTVECEKCEYADLTVGAFQGNASLRTISRHTEGVIPVPLKGRKRVWLDNVDRKQLDGVLNDIDTDIEAFAITGSPKIESFAFLERFSGLKYVYLWWNNKATSLWDFTKTPNVEFLRLDAFNRLSDISQIEKAKKLRYLKLYAGNESIDSLKPLERHPSLEVVSLWRKVDDADLNALISIPKLKYLDCHFNIFDIDAYAAFEAKRPDVDTSFWEGLYCYEYDRPNENNSYYVGLAGRRQGIAEANNTAKQEKHRLKYLSVKRKYSATEI